MGKSPKKIGLREAFGIVEPKPIELAHSDRHRLGVAPVIEAAKKKLIKWSIESSGKKLAERALEQFPEGIDRGRLLSVQHFGGGVMISSNMFRQQIGEARLDYYVQENEIEGSLAKLRLDAGEYDVQEGTNHDPGNLTLRGVNRAIWVLKNAMHYLPSADNNELPPRSSADI